MTADAIARLNQSGAIGNRSGRAKFWAMMARPALLALAILSTAHAPAVGLEVRVLRGTEWTAYRLDQDEPRKDLQGASINIPQAAEARVATYLNDPTLRVGDVVAVNGKLLVFHGGTNTAHRVSDFKDLRQPPTGVGAHARELQAIDRALRAR